MGGILQGPPLDHEADGPWLVELRHDVLKGDPRPGAVWEKKQQADNIILPTPSVANPQRNSWFLHAFVDLAEECRVSQGNAGLYFCSCAQFAFLCHPGQQAGPFHINH